VAAGANSSLATNISVPPAESASPLSATLSGDKPPRFVVPSKGPVMMTEPWERTAIAFARVDSSPPSVAEARVLPLPPLNSSRSAPPSKGFQGRVREVEELEDFALDV
jgi:hypothetical protein